MIPKKIHYCWFGRGEKNEKAKKCIASWHRFCPDYEIIEWNEDNFDVNMNGYTEMCIREKKYAFLSDYARLLILEREGGLYFDLDVEIVRSMDTLLDNKAFFGFENRDYVATGLGFGTEAGNPAVRAMLAEYDELLDGKHGTVDVPSLTPGRWSVAGWSRTGRCRIWAVPSFILQTISIRMTMRWASCAGRKTHTPSIGTPKAG